MSTENKLGNQELLAKLQQARTLLDECVAGLGGQPLRRPKKKPPLSRSHKPHTVPSLDFDVHERAFVKTHGRTLNGPKRFVLLLAYLTKGQVGKEIQLKEVEKHWNKMTAPSLLAGEFNRFYTNGAKEKGWVNTKKTGAYFLRASWQDIFK